MTAQGIRISVELHTVRVGNRGAIYPVVADLSQKTASGLLEEVKRSCFSADWESIELVVFDLGGSPSFGVTFDILPYPGAYGLDVVEAFPDLYDDKQKEIGLECL